jgi:hypothetical protein
LRARISTREALRRTNANSASTNQPLMAIKARVMRSWAVGEAIVPRGLDFAGAQISHHT